PVLREPAWGFPGFEGLFALSFGITGALITRRRRGNVVGWVLLADGILAALQLITDVTPPLIRAGSPAGSAAEAWVSWVSTWIWVPGVACIGLLLLLFPDGRTPGPRWRAIGALLGLGTVLMLVAFALLPGDLLNFPGVKN